jgi:hypothetical protein
MADAYDFAIFGASPAAALLAGLLAHDHGRQVIRIADPVSSQRLPRALDLALPFATRPASWRLVRDGAVETRQILASLEAGDLLAETDVRVVADHPATKTALAHMRHVAAGYGVRVHGDDFLGVPRLGGEIGLETSTVQTVSTARVAMSFSRAGVASLALDGEAMPAGQIVLADDAAILAHLPEAQRPELLAAEAMTATLTAPARRLPAPVMRFPDRGATLMQRPDHSVLALVAGDAEVERRLAACLTGPFPLQRRASTHYHRLVSRDGAPVIGRLRPSRMFAVAATGEVGVFLAPALARLLAGVPTAPEKAWFGAHDPARPSRVAIADVGGIAA